MEQNLLYAIIFRKWRYGPYDYEGYADRIEEEKVVFTSSLEEMEALAKQRNVKGIFSKKCPVFNKDEWKCIKV